ncbi:MAG: HMA2 domain-containing protein [Nostochopsis sp.]
MTKTISSREGLSRALQPSSGLIFADQQSDEVHNHKNEVSTRSTARSMLGKLKIIHITQGRVRIRAIDVSQNSILESLSRQLREHHGVTEVTINHKTSSLVVKFDETRLSLPQILAILQEFGIQQHQTVSDSQNNSDPFAAWKSVEFWKEQGLSFIPLFVGLGVTGAIGIKGLAAIPVYMITADATQRVIGYIEPQLLGSKKNKKLNTASATKSITKPQVTPQTSLAKVEQITTIKRELFPVKNVDNAKITYNIVHAIPGRIRMSVPKLAHDRDYAKRLERLLKTDPQVTNVRVNCDAASVAIAYQPSNIKASRWVDLMQLAQEETASHVIQKDAVTQTHTETQQQKEFQTTKVESTPEVIGLWANFKAPALSYALTFMVNFPINAAPD